MKFALKPALVLLLGACLLAACATEQDLLDDEYGMDGELSPVPAPGKADSENRTGLLVNTDTRATQVWSARNKWEDRDTEAARLAGIAWPANSGLNWDEKYAVWINDMERTQGTAGYYDTFVLTTPWGKELPSPSLECAEMSIFLRITFSAWYELPFFMEAVDSDRTRVYFGHNGVRTQNGRYKNTAEYGNRYRDYTNQSPEEYQANWPTDTRLQGRKLYGGTDTQPMLGEGKVFGAYVDAIHLNKRVGYFTMLSINYLGSMNLADTANTYNIVPEAVRPGDVLLERWQRRGIGHTLVIKTVIDLGAGNKDVHLISGSMPRRQGKLETGSASKRSFTTNYSGGVGENNKGDRYAALGGGLKRFRVTKNIRGYWTNTWMTSDEAHWINSNDFDRIGARPARFEQLLGEVSPEQLREELLAQIDDARRHLRNYPASCAARERRERAFEELYELSSAEFGHSKSVIDQEHRRLEDDVLRELVYDQSKTCCWNSTNSTMYEIIMAYAQDEQDNAAAGGVCVRPTVFMNHTDEYQRWKNSATASGLGSAWVSWTEDERCEQRNVSADTIQESNATDFCSRNEVSGDECTDDFEPNQNTNDATILTIGADKNLQLCDNDTDWFVINSAANIEITFTHSAGDLDLAAYDDQGNQVSASQSTDNIESLSIQGAAYIKVYGYQGATGAYRLRVF